MQNNRKQKNENLIEQSYRNIIECSPLGIYIYRLIDNGLIFSGYNQAADHIIGIDHSILMGKKIEEAFPGLADTGIPERYREVANNGTVWQTDEITYDQGGIKGAYAVTAFRSAPETVTVQFMDITRQKRTETELRLFKEAVDSSSNAIGMSTPDGRHFYQNRAFDEMFGKVGEDPRKTMFVDRELGREIFKKVMSDGGFEGEVELYSRNGAILTVHMKAYASKDSNGKVILVVGILNDITGKKKAEEEKWKLMEMSQRNQKLESLGTLAGGIAHDFNNLLSGLFGYIDLALRESSDIGKIKHYLAEAMEAMDRSMALTGQLLTFSKGGAPIVKTQPLFPFISESINLHAQRNEHKLQVRHRRRPSSIRL